MSVIENPTSTERVGSFNGITFVRHKGKFRGKTISGDFAVPYEITTPENTAQGNRTIIFEPPHFSSGPIARDIYLGPGFLWNRGFSHASVGYSNFNLRILDPEPEPPFTFRINGKDVKVIRPGESEPIITDDNILRQFAFTLRETRLPFLGTVERIYAIGFSDSGNTIYRVYQPFGQKLFDISLACTVTFPKDKPYPTLINGESPIMVFNTEADFDVRTVPNPSFTNCRWYAVAGGPHIPDTRRTRMAFPDPSPPFSPAPPVAGTSPIDPALFIKALFVAGDAWVRQNTQPPPSIVLKVNPGGLIARDAIGNAFGGIRHPALELKEATFIASIVRGKAWELFGAYSNPREKIDNYLTSFERITAELRKARFLLPADQLVLNQRAALHPPDTFTINYMLDRFNQTQADEDALLPLAGPISIKEQDLRAVI